MSERDWKILFQDMVESAEKIQRYTDKLSFDDFVIQHMVIDAVVRNLEIIGEAANRVPKNIQEKFSKIHWRKIIGLRNRIIHEYFGVDLSIIWYIITNEIPNLKIEILNALKEI